MKKLLPFLCLSILWATLACSPNGENEPEQFDVVVYGANSAGIIAAYTAKTMGKSVILIEPTAHLGGLTTGGLGYTDIGNKYAVTGLSRDFYRRLGNHYGKFEQWIFEPSVAQKTFQEYLDRAGIEVYYDYRVIASEKKDGYIREIELEQSSNPSLKTNWKVAGKMFIDATYEGDLMALSGVSYTIGREANEKYSETYNGVQLMKGHQFPDGIDPYKTPGDPSSGLLWGISDGKLEPDGTGDDKIQAYNYRICLTNDPGNRVEITKPEGYDHSMFDFLVRLFEAQPNSKNLNNYFIWSQMPNNKTDINNRGGFSTDMIGMNYEYPEADYRRRKEIIDEHTHYTKSLLYFYKTDPRVPKEIQEQIQEWGYPKDEYTDNGHWSPQLYVREVRRMVGEYVMTQANCVGDEVVEDGVGMAAYTMDSHNIQRIVIEKDGKTMVKNEGNVEIGGFGPYPIAYRSIIPKAEDAKNLFVPAAMSASHIAFGSIRMEPVFMVLGQSSAVAACLAIDEGKTVQEVNVAALQKELKENPLADGSIAEILVDNDSWEGVKVTGDWERVSSGGYGPSYLRDASKGASQKSARFSPSIQNDSQYDVYVYFSRTKEASSRTLIELFDGKEKREIMVREEDIRVEGQTSGEWVHLGQFAFKAGTGPYVEISNKKADGVVVADAVLFVPKNK
ncbi:FAD-dependent oxidoreductase [Algoriphagus sp.]|uniref:FAD-dependent oxidoreductase n=1 Tax=Algoriphagus sp. TaxID=1872435 RepID=UPI002721F7A2|nr:FAD-dependent oxidoreductase [Algoriphagus sp.]MDO8966299.1 FAD-dependent oxidoreductase [Algoriphagus sp.]MDP3198274.1 FAD-dependent oxidoreductase [Algoriphagus sp.]